MSELIKSREGQSRTVIYLDADVKEALRVFAFTQTPRLTISDAVRVAVDQLLAKNGK